MLFPSVTNLGAFVEPLNNSPLVAGSSLGHGYSNFQGTLRSSTFKT